ncbi:MAG: 5'-nucleotidase C-terminal domain-containing protein [Odoribacter sp.]
MKKILLFSLLLLIACDNMAQARDTISIVSFNDFHGAFIAGDRTPGADNFVSTLLALKKSVPHPLILSAGDNFSGSYFSLMTKGEPRQVFTLPPAPDTLVSAIGNHEFDWGKDYLINTSCRYIQYVGANIKKYKDGGDFKKHVPDYCIVKRGNSSIAIIGLTTPTTIIGGKKPYVDSLVFEEAFSSKVNALSERLRKEKKVDIIVLLMHIGTEMKDGVPVVAQMEKKEERELKKITDIDVIVSGHSHQLVKGMFDIGGGRKVPMIQAGANGSHIGLQQLEVSTNGLRLIKDTLIAVCLPHVEIKQEVDSIGKAHEFNEIYVTVSERLIHDRDSNLYDFTQVGALVTASYLYEYAIATSKKGMNPTGNGDSTDRPVIAVQHFKGIRTDMYEGKLTRAQVGNVLPFGGSLNAYRMSGADVKALFTEGLDNTRSRGRLQTCNMAFEITDGKITAMWIQENKQYKEITDTMECIVLCDDFIAFGGDGYDKNLFQKKIQEFSGKITTTAFVNYMKQARKVPNDSYRLAKIGYKSSENTEVETTIEDGKSGETTDATATME